MKKGKIKSLLITIAIMAIFSILILYIVPLVVNIITPHAFENIFNFDKEDKGLIIWGSGATHTIEFYVNISNSYHLGGYVLIYIETNNILYFIGDDIEKYSKSPDEYIISDVKYIKIKDRYIKFDYNESEFNNWTNIEEIPYDDRIYYEVMEKELINWLNIGRLELDERGILKQVGKITNENGNVENIKRFYYYYELKNYTLDIDHN